MESPNVKNPANKNPANQIPARMSPAEILGDAVRERREALGLRQTEVADLAGCSTRFLHTLENGKPTLRVDKVLDVLVVLGLDLVLVAGRGQIRAGASGSLGAPETLIQ
jgi:HTH-type transcriptional regulator / antitoxin HipB